ncbi:MAG TPA: TonB family protein [Thermoanaerobaculia bacterium]|nr:TonB family protein [Thermoanaerobaculia bacterium]
MAKKLLLIENEPRYIDKVRLAGGPDFDVTVAREGDEGLAAFDRERPDLVVVTAALQKMRVNDVIRDLRRKGGPTAPPILLMMSGYKGSNPKADAQKIGAFDILEKPFSDETFRSIAFEAIDSTDPGAQTMRIDASKLQGGLTSSDIFADVLEDLQPEEAAPPPRSSAATIPDLAIPSPAPAPPRASAPAPNVDQRLEDTLSGILSPKKSAPAAPPARPAPMEPPKPASAAPAPRPAPPAPVRPAGPPPLPKPAEPSRPAPRASTDLEVENMISQTLSGMAISKPKPAAPAKPAAAAPPPPAPAAAAKKAPAPSDKDRFGQFQLMEKIATGGMAEVWKARMSGVDGFQKIVAIKKILPHMAASEDFITMFADEAKLAAQLNHPNIIHIYDLGKVENSYYIAMEYVEGRDLRSILKSGADHGLPLPPELALFVASKLAAALDYAHRRKDFNGQDLSLVHRDVSPQNVLISYEGDIKLCDFGIAKAASKSSQTQAGALKGKLQYMSPEQASGKPLDRRSDLFSLGSVLYEMLTGEKLFAGDTDLTILEQVRNVKAAAPSTKNPDVPKRVDAIVLKALAKSPEERYQNASDLQRDLESVLYTFSPAPGSADLAIYLHHLQAEEKGAAAGSERAFDQAFTPSKPEPAAPAKSKKAKGTVVQRKTGTVPGVPMPASPAPVAAAEPAVAGSAEGVKHDTKSGVFGAYSSKRVEAEKKGRAPLVAGIAVAALVLIGVIVAVTRKHPAPPVAVPSAATTSAAPATTSAAPAATTTAASSTLTEKQIEDEVKKQLAQKQKELEKAQAAQKKNAAPPPASASAAAPTAVASDAIKPPVPMPIVPEPTSPQPTAISVPKKIASAPASAPPPAEPAAAAVSRGDLVGPGPGVVEPELVSRLAVNYPLAVRQERVSGRVVILALVDENGKVQSARIQTGVATRTGVNQAIVDAVKRARFRPATKDGVPVKMYKAIPVDVNP